MYNYISLQNNLASLVESMARHEDISAIQAIQLYQIATSINTVQNVDVYLKRIPKEWIPATMNILNRATIADD